MNKFIYPLIALILLNACASESSSAKPSPEQEKQLLEQARSRSATFATDLKKELFTAMGEGGTLNALEVCHSVAPAMAEKMSAELGFSIQRVSLKQRNPKNNPDPFEQDILEKWQSESPSEDYYQIVKVKQQYEFRYMKALKVQEACLKCHGPKENMSKELITAIEKWYPEDSATGYKVGDLRGAISVRIPVVSN